MMTYRTLTLLKSLFLGSAALALASATHAAEGPAGHTHGHDSTVIGQPAKATAGTRTVQIKLIDIAFEPESVKVKAGETVRFVITNAGQLLHEFNLGTAQMHAEHRKEMAMMMEHGMITPTGVDEKMMKMDHSNMPGMQGHSMKHDDPNSVLIAPGETKELVWKFTKAVDLEFACNIPGHYEAGMVGKVDVSR
jgi:uncharacterized cupredoxin-like copper-binding protein